MINKTASHRKLTSSKLVALAVLSVSVALGLASWNKGSETVRAKVETRCKLDGELARSLCAPCAEAAARNPLHWDVVDNEDLTGWCLRRVGSPVDPMTGAPL